jgi:hypothetical protein
MPRSLVGLLAAAGAAMGIVAGVAHSLVAFVLVLVTGSAAAYLAVVGDRDETQFASKKKLCWQVPKE